MAILQIKNGEGEWQEIPVLKGERGIQGVTFTPHLAEDGTLTFTNDGGLPNPDPVNIMGPQGPAGESGSGSADVSNLIPKIGNRGKLAGYEEWFPDGSIDEWDGSVIINPDAPDLSVALTNITVEPIDESWLSTETGLRSFTKIVYVSAAFGNVPTVTLGNNWVWQNETVPTLGVGLLIFHVPFAQGFGFACYVPFLGL